MKKKKSLAEIHPELTKQWHPTKNGNLKPEDVTYGCTKKVWWFLPYDVPEDYPIEHLRGKHFDFEWPAVISSRARGTGCPFLSNHAVWVGFNDLATTHPDLAKEWHPTKNGNLKPTNVTAGYKEKVMWFLPYDVPADYPVKHLRGKHFDFEWPATVTNRTRDRGCPFVAGKAVWQGFNDLKSNRPDVADEWDYEKNGNLRPEEFTLHSGKRVGWKCAVCGHRWPASIDSRTREDNPRGCPKCSKYQRTSFPEQAIYYYIKKHFPDAVNGYSEIFEGSMELDIYIPSVNMGIEYDGARWHRSSAYEKEKRKYDICRKNGIRLIRIVESEEQYERQCADCYILLHQNEIDGAIIHLLSLLTGNSCFYINTKEDRLDILSSYKNKIPDNSLSAKYPKIAKEWDYEQNGGLSPDNIAGRSREEVSWKCEKGHTWKAMICNRTRKNDTGCPYCSGRYAIPGETDLQTLFPEIASQWDYEKNDKLPSDVRPQCGDNVYWKCKHGYEWQAIIQNRTKHGTICPRHCKSKKTCPDYRKN